MIKKAKAKKKKKHSREKSITESRIATINIQIAQDTNKN